MTRPYEGLLAENEALLAENEKLHKSLDESQELLQAISRGEIDALVLSGLEGEQVYSLEGADRAYRILIEAMNDGAVTMTSEGTILYCNRHFADMIRSSLEKVIGSSFYRFIQQADQTAFRVLQQRLGRGELTLQAEEKSIIPVYISINSLQLSESQEAFCVIITDLTEQKHKEEIVAAEKLARSIIDQATEVVVVCDEEGKIIRFSNAVLRILGSDPSLQSFEHLFNLHNPIGEKLSPVSAALRGEVLLQAEASFKRSDGLQFHLLLNAGPLKNADGKIIGCVITLTDITERKKAEDNIQQLLNSVQREKNRLLTLINNIPDEVWCFDADGNVELVNPPVVREFGSGLINLIGAAEINDNSEVYQPDGKPRQAADFPPLRALKGETVVGQEEVILVPSSGELRTRQVNASPVKDAEGNVVGAVAIVRDITECKKAEEALAFAAEKFEKAFHGNASAMVLTHVEDGLVVDANQAWLDLTGFSRREVIGKTAAEHGGWKDAEERAAMVEELNAHGSIRNRECACRKKSGEEYIVLLFAQPIMIQGEPLLLSSSIDITARKEAEKALRESEARFRSVLDNSLDVIYRLNLQTDRYEYFSPACEAVYGFSLAEMTAMNAQETLEHVHPNDLPGIKTALENIHAIGQGRIEFRWLAKSGEYRWLSANLAIAKDSAGQPLYRDGVARDITERKKAEEALRKSEANMARAQKFAHLGNWEWDLKTNALSGSDEHYRIYGLEPGNYPMDTLINLVHKDDRQYIRDSWLAALYDGKPYDVECRVVRPDGSIAILHGEGEAIFNENGQLKGMFGIAQDITERKQAEEAVAKSHRQIQSIIDNTPAIVYAFDLEERFVMANTALAELLNSTPEQMIGKRRHEFMPKEDADWHEANDRQVIEAGRSLEFEECGQLKDRSITWLTTKFPLRDAQGSIYAVAGISPDISERKRAEEELRKSEERYRLLFEQANDGIVIHMLSIDREESKFIQVNDVISRMLGYTREEMLQISPHDIQDKEELADIPAETMVLNGKRKLHFEKTLIGRDGRKITADIHSTVFNLKGNQVVLSIIRDITERKQMEEALRKAKYDLEQKVLERTAELTEANLALKESEDRFRVALKNAPIVVFNQDRDLRYTWLYNPNPAFTQDTALGKTDEELLPPEDAAQLTKIKRRVLESGCGERAEVRTTFNGEGFFYDLTAEPLRSASGEIEGITCASMDITYRKKAEEELKSAKEAAEAAARAKSEFLANMSHEIRTPMNAIIGMTELILDEPMDPVQRENLELVRTNGDALLTIINDILDFSKMESDKPILEEQAFNLRSCVEESIDLVAIKAAEKGLNLAYSIDKKVPVVIIGDPGRLRQVMGNLLSNAVKFTDKGEVMLSVSIDESNEIHFAVQDTGIGIPQGSLHQLFQPFSQMEPSTTRLYGGTGLGLAISKKLVELMGGRIWAESQEGIGSMFHFTIKAPSDKSEIKTPAISPQMISKRVLIVEDNKTNRRILSKQVYDWGMIPMAASSGQEALNWIRRGDDFDIAILDIDLPDMSGLKLENEISKYNRTLPLVLLISLGKRIPPNHAYLTKPIKPSKLYQVMIEILPKELTKSPVQQVSASQPIQNHPLRILIAEDNTSHQRVTQQMLKRLGYKADIVANGIEALHALERQHYDVVFMDIKMPVMDGLEATRIIRQRWLHDSPRIIALTAYGLKGDRERFIEAGMDDYISKPVQKEDLAKMLKRYG